MSTKASPPRSSAAVAAISSATSTTATTTASGVIKIKSELPSDEIKEYAENTMNELLGWYGFDGVDRLELSAKPSSRLLSQSNNNNINNILSHHQMEKRRSRNRATTLLSLQQQQNIRNNNNTSNNNSNFSNSRNKNTVHNNNSNSTRGQSTAGCGGNESTTSDHDTRSSREDDSKSPHSAGKTTIDEKIDYNNCCWCRRTVPENAPEFLTTTDGPRYCSESCFTQSRRASFKKAKTCDWCKHVRHAVSYVDFQDGASQLQFCSDKCLNQYKMQIFCKETQAHLDMNPHLRDQGLEAAASGNSAGLITPDLWLRNCRSRSASPASTLSISPAPSAAFPTITAAIARLSPPALSQASGVTDHKPIISVTPASKLMSKSPGILSSNRQSPKHSRKKRSLRSTLGATEVGSSIKINHGNMRREVGNLGAAGASQLLNTTKSLLGVSMTNSLRASPGQTSNANSSSSSMKLSSTPTLSQFAASSVQDLHMSVPPLSPMLDQQAPPTPHQHPSLAAHPGVGVRGNSIPSAFFATPPPGGQQHGNMPQPPTASHLGSGFQPRPSPFMQNPSLAGVPRFMASMGFPHMQPPPHLMQPDMGGFSALLGAQPPVTVMVPYPIIIPLPIPIPVPLPIIDFYRAHLTPEERQRLKQQELKQESAREETQQKLAAVEESEQRVSELGNSNSSDEPLDCSKTRDTPPFIMQPVKEVAASIPSAEADPEEPQLPTAEHTPTTLITSIEHAESPATDSKPMHCIVPSVAPADLLVPADNQPGASPTPNPDDADNPAEDDTNQKLPKFKITRLHTKRTLLQTKESECSRPLRKRKRIIDCDFQKIALSNKDIEQQEEQLESVVAAVATACNSQTKNSSRK